MAENKILLPYNGNREKRKEMPRNLKGRTVKRQMRMETSRPSTCIKQKQHHKK
jgi:hypothetical protein